MWDMQAFAMAHTKAVETRNKNFLIVVVTEKLPRAEVPPEMLYFITHELCVDVTRSTKDIISKIR